MARDRNVFLVVGRLGSVPEMRYTPNGLAVTNFSLAVNDDYYDKKKGDWVERVHWLRFVCYGDLAERVAKLDKGDKLDVSGKIVNGDYTDSSGKKVYRTDLVANTVIVLVRNKSSQADSGQRSTGKQSGGEDDIPF